MNEPRKTKRYKRKMKRRKVTDKIWTIIQKILMGDAGRIGTSGVCLKYLKDELPDQEKVLISFSFGILTTASDGVHFLQEMEDLEEATHRTGLGSVVSPSNAAEYIKDLIASGFNPAVMWGVDGLLKIRNVDDLMEAGDDLKKLSDLVDPKDLKELGDREEEEDVSEAIGFCQGGPLGEDAWQVSRAPWNRATSQDQLDFLEHLSKIGKKTLIFDEGRLPNTPYSIERLIENLHGDDWEEEDELDREYGITPPGDAGPDVWYMKRSTWFEAPPEDRLYFLEYIHSVGKKEVILTDGEEQESYQVDVILDVYQGWKRRKDQGIEGTEPNEWKGRLVPILTREYGDVPPGRTVTVKPGEVTTHYDPQDPEGSDLIPDWNALDWDYHAPEGIKPLIPEIFRESSVPQIQEAFITGLTNLINDRNWRENVHQRMMDSDPE